MSFLHCLVLFVYKVCNNINVRNKFYSCEFLQITTAAAAQRQEGFHITCPRSSESYFWESSSSSVRLQTQAVRIRVGKMMAGMRMLNSNKKRTGTRVTRRKQAWQMFSRTSPSRWDYVTWLKIMGNNYGLPNF